LKPNQKAGVDEAVATIADDPTLGEAKTGGLAGVFVYKFQCVGSRFLLAYEHDPKTRWLLLVRAHEDCYRDLKR
jgi:mRNA interferase RelE/StbE